MNPLIQAAPPLRERDAKPQPLKYLLAVALIVGLFSAAAVVTGFIPAAHDRLAGNAPALRIAHALGAATGEDASCVG